MPPRCSFHEGFTSPRPVVVESEPPTERLYGAACAGSSSSSSSSSNAAVVAGTAAPNRGASKYGKVAAGGGRYGNLKRGDDNQGPPPAAAPRVYPKSANFAIAADGTRDSRRTGDFDVDEEQEAPQSARAAVRSWSASGGTREATFKRRPASHGKFGNDGGGNVASAVGFAVILNAADNTLRTRSRGSFDEEEDDDQDASVVALWLEQLIVKLETQEVPRPRAPRRTRHIRRRAPPRTHRTQVCPWPLAQGRSSRASGRTAFQARR